MNRSLPTGAWIAGGLVTAALIIPGATYAAATMTEIVGTNNKPAKVSKANQLYVAPTDAANYVTAISSFASPVPTGCYAVSPLGSATQSAVFTDIRGAVEAGNPAKDDVELFTGDSCNGVAIADFNGQTGSFDQSASPGIALPKGTDLSIQLDNGSGTFSAKFFIDGYTMPGSAVPAGSHVRQVTLRSVG